MYGVIDRLFEAVTSSRRCDTTPKETSSAISEVNSTTLTTNVATSDANSATSDANSATSDANSATSDANSATSDANSATSDANSATSDANSATSENNLNKRSSRENIESFVLSVCKDWMSIEELVDRVGKSRSHIRNKTIPSLIAQDKLLMSYPDTPNHPKQKYRAKPKN